jgi:Flp pilus assembly protein CpaB
MRRRAVYLGAFAVLALVAAGLTLRAQHTISVVVATHDLKAGSVVTAQDVEVARMHEDSVPAGALSNVDNAVGQYVGWPLTSGEPILSRALRSQRSGAAVLAGLDVPAGYRAVAVPVQPAAAVGGMLSRGDRVDVYATPLPGRDTAGSVTTTTASGNGAAAQRPTSAALLGHEVLVLQLRSDQGQALDEGSGDSVHGLNFGAGKLGSVVLAVPDADVDLYATAVAGQSIYLALSVG